MISVLMSIYNGEKYLNKSITSVLDQSYKNFEFIIINDCSTDKSKKLINEGSIPYIMPQERSIDIDENFQLELAKKIISYEKI